MGKKDKSALKVNTLLLLFWIVLRFSSVPSSCAPSTVTFALTSNSCHHLIQAAANLLGANMVTEWCSNVTHMATTKDLVFTVKTVSFSKLSDLAICTVVHSARIS